MTRSNLSAFLTATMLTLTAAGAFAQSRPDIRPIVVIVEGSDPGIAARDVHTAIASELKVPVIAPGDAREGGARGVLVVSFGAPSSGELVVRYQPSADGVGEPRKEMARRVASPATAAESLRAAAFLAGNLARDEAAEILEEQRLAALAAREDAARRAEDAAQARAAEARATEVRARTEAAPRESVVRAAAESTPEEGCKALARGTWHPAVASLFYPVATNMGRPNVRTNLQLDLLYGRTGFVDGLSAGVVGRNECDVAGLQATALAGWIGGTVSGVQTSALGAIARRVDGVQAGAGFAVARDVTGLQASAGFAWGKERVVGALVAPVSLAGRVEGAQIGAVAIARDLRGAQVASINVADDVDGVQIGVINVARNVRGAQIGIINVAEDVDGPSVALIPLAKSGAVRPTAFGSILAYGNVGVEFDTRYVFAVASVGYGGHGVAGEYGVGGFQLGAHVLRPPQDRGWFLDPMIGNHVALETDRTDDSLVFFLRLRAGYRFAPRLALFGGAGGALLAEAPAARVRPREIRLRPDVFVGVLF